MGFVKTKEELSAIQKEVGNPRFTNCEMLMVEFLTRPDIVEHVLPPGLDPGTEPSVSAMVGRWQSNGMGNFEGGAIYVSARHKAIEGTYVLAMYMSTDTAILYGREVFGEPKKQANMGLYRLGNRMSGWIERKGVRLIELGADLNNDLDISEPLKLINFNIKAFPATNGIGMEDDAFLTLAELEGRLTTNREGVGSVVLRGTRHDPLDELEIVNVRGAVYLEGDLVGKARTVARIPSDDFLPYFYARTDDFSAPDLKTDKVLKNPL